MHFLAVFSSHGRASNLQYTLRMRSADSARCPFYWLAAFSSGRRISIKVIETCKVNLFVTFTAICPRPPPASYDADSNLDTADGPVYDRLMWHFR